MKKCCYRCKNWHDGDCGIYIAARYAESWKVNSCAHLSSVQAEKFINSFYCSEFKETKVN